MAKLADPFGSGIGFSIEAARDYPTAKKCNESSRKRTSIDYLQDLTCGSDEADQDDNEIHRDKKAFQELQSYADFQKTLSNRLQGEIQRDMPPIDPQLFSQREVLCDYSSHQLYGHSSPQQSSSGSLSCPVTILQRRYPGDKCWERIRPYKSDLMECGIDQQALLNFLDAFNESSKVSPYLNAVNVAEFGIELAPSITQMLISKAASVVTRTAKTTHMEKKSKNFITCANKELFIPHGLFALVITYRLNTTSQSLSASPSQLPLSSHSATVQPTAYLQNKSTAALPCAAPSLPPNRQTELKRVENLTTIDADCGGQARDAFANPEPTESWSQCDDENSKIVREEEKSKVRPNGIVMEQDVLYLVIVHDPSSVLPSSASLSSPPQFLNPQPPYPYREAKVIKSPSSAPVSEASQQPWTLSPRGSLALQDGYSQTSPASGTPPAYPALRRSVRRNTKREQKYCVPTL